MFKPNYDRQAVVDFVNRELGERFSTCTAIGFGDPIVAGIVYHNWNPETAVIEISAASSRRDWISRDNLKTVFNYPFDELGCQLCIARISERNTRARRIWRAIGASEHLIPRLYGRAENAVIACLPVEAWREFEGRM